MDPLHFESRFPGIGFALVRPMCRDKRFVYVLKNTDTDPHFYVGLTSDVKSGLADHNAGRCPHAAATAMAAPRHHRIL